MTLNQVRVLVTGATGFIGRPVCHRLVELGAVVYGLARSASVETVSAGVVPLSADVTDRSGIIATLEHVRPALVLHMAAAGVTEPFLPIEQALEVNVSGTINVLEASYKVGVQRFVHIGTAYERPASEIERGPNNPYVASKMAAWSFWRAFIEKNVIESLAVRLYHVYGPGQARGLIPAAMQAAYRNETFRMTPGEQLRDFVYIDDVVDGLVATLTSPEVHGKTYDMGSGVGHQVKAVVHRIFDLMNSRGQYVPGTLDYRPREEMELIAEPATTQIDLNWSAKVPFEEGLVTTIESYRQQVQSL